MCTDELTILSRKEDVPLIGFELAQVLKKLAACSTSEGKRMMQERLRAAKKKGWLDEHLYLAKLVDEF
jgi:hypothetical protein